MMVCRELPSLVLTIWPLSQADGHCLYRSIEDQLSRQQQQQQEGQPSPTVAVPSGYQQLREQAAAYIRAHPDDFIPFIFDEVKKREL